MKMTFKFKVSSSSDLEKLKQDALHRSQDRLEEILSTTSCPVHGAVPPAHFTKDVEGLGVKLRIEGACCPAFIEAYQRRMAETGPAAGLSAGPTPASVLGEDEADTAGRRARVLYIAVLAVLLAGVALYFLKQ
jgi:hypothetical protein